MKYLLGLDNGGTIVKAGIFDMGGRPVSVGKCQVKLILPQDYFVERSYDKFGRRTSPRSVRQW